MTKLINIFKNKLNQREFGLEEKYWADLEKKLDKHSKGGSGIGGKILFGLLAGLVIGLGTLLFYPQSEENQITPVAENSSSPQKLNSQLQESAPAETHEQPIEKTRTAENSISNKQIESRKPGISTNNESGLIHPSVINTASLAKVKKDESVNARTNSAESKPKTKSEEIISNENEVNNPKENSAINELSLTIVPSEQTINNSESNESENKTENKTTPASYAPSFAHQVKENESAAIPALLLMNIIKPVEIPRPYAAPKAVFSSKKHPARKDSYFLGAYAGILYTDKILNTTDTTMFEYVERRKNEESPLVSQNFGIDFGIGQDCWNISVGINYHRQGEIADYKPEFYQWAKNISSTWNITDNSYYDKDTAVISYLVSEGNWQTVEDTLVYWNSAIQSTDTQMVSMQQYVVDTTYLQYVFHVDSSLVADFDSTEIQKVDSVKELIKDPSYKQEKFSTRISYVEFPVMVGYEYPFSRFTLMLRTGFSIGMLTKVDAVYLKNDLSGTEQIETSRMSKTMLNYLLHLGVNYYLDEHFVLNFDPMLRINVNSALKTPAYNQRYWNAGVNVGLMYRF